MPKQKKGEDYLEIQRIYFDEAYQGGGRGKNSSTWLSKAKEYHKTKIWLGVWEHNPQALRFYEKEGLSLQVHMNFILVMS